MKPTRSMILCGVVLFSLLQPMKAAAAAGEDDWEKFLKHVIDNYLMPNGLKWYSIPPIHLASYMGYALGRQAPFVQGNPEYRQILNGLHDKLMEFQDKQARRMSQESSVPYEQLRREYQDRAAAAFAGYADEQVERAIRVPQRIPSIFAAERFSLRDFGLARIAGPYVIRPVGFAGNTYQVRLLTDSHAVGYQLSGGVAAAWTFTETKIWFRDARGNIAWQFDWAGNGGFKGYPVFQNSPDTAREYRMERTDGESFSSPRAGGADRGSESGGRGFMDWLSPVNDPEFAARVARGMGARDRVATTRAEGGGASGGTVVIPTDALDPQYITAHIIELVGNVRDRNLDGIRAGITGEAADQFNRKGAKILSDEPFPPGSIESLVRKIIPTVTAEVVRVRIDPEKKTAEATVTLIPGNMSWLALYRNTIILEWVGSARGDWKIRGVEISPELENLKDLLRSMYGGEER